MTQLSCPWCSEVQSIRRSRFRMQDLLRMVLGSKPYRCRSCGTRFYQRGGSLPPSAPKVNRIPGQN